MFEKLHAKYRNWGSLEIRNKCRRRLGTPTSVVMASVFLSVWKLRVDKSRIQLYKVRAQLEANINLLREIRFSNQAVLPDQLVASYF